MKPLLLLLLAGCPSPGTAPPNTSTTMPTHTDAHPGQITFRDLDAGTEREAAVATVPKSIAWVTVDGVRVPVVRVDSRAMPDGGREVQSFGVDGALLSTTISRPPPR